MRLVYRGEKEDTPTFVTKFKWTRCRKAGHCMRTQILWSAQEAEKGADITLRILLDAALGPESV